MADFSLQIRDWYRLNKRDLPWRETKDPYKIWLSEIILQQTRVDQGLAYYEKFITHFPELKTLADANEQLVLNLWQGLGYYSRARNLHFAAKQVMEEFEGIFPSSYAEILKLKGVGKYTAAAISSFAFGESQGVVDGNVFRVLSRVFDIDEPIDSAKGQKTFQSLANELISDTHPSDHNQAIMELGALVCSPSNPDCDSCPVQNMCLAKANNTIAERPVKSKKVKVTDRFFHYLVVQDGTDLLIEKRTDGIWKNMYQFPLIEAKSKDLPGELENIRIHHEYSAKHILSHQRIHATFYQIDVLPDQLQTEGLLKVSFQDLADYPIPRLIDRYLEDVDL
ncbi:MAG: A/G-specific adenine glycosylase [Crocinitomicaceae bacterium]